MITLMASRTDVPDKHLGSWRLEYGETHDAPCLVVIEDSKHIWKLVPPFAGFRNRWGLKGETFIIGFIGARGAGKSVGAVHIAIWDYMLRGYQVWSNLDISFRFAWEHPEGSGKLISKEFHSRPLDDISLTNLDEVYSNGLLFVDEINMEFAESRRSMSRKNLMFSYILQQLRKRKLNLIWTAQSESHCDDRLRWQTDFFVKCKDMKRIPGTKFRRGEASFWVVYDTSGIVTGEPGFSLEDMEIWRGTILNRPWWNAYDTYQLQGINRQKLEQAKIAQSGKNGRDPRQLAYDLIAYATKNNIFEMPRADAWSILGLTDDPGAQISVGLHLKSLGVEQARHGRKGTRYFDFINSISRGT